MKMPNFMSAYQSGRGRWTMASHLLWSPYNEQVPIGEGGLGNGEEKLLGGRGRERG